MPNDKPENPAWRNARPAVLLGGGIGLIVLSLVWPGQAVSRASWSSEQAEAYSAASLKLHSLSVETVGKAGSNNEMAMRKKVDQAKAEYDILRRELDSAITRPKHISWFLRIIGALLAITALATLYNRANH